MPFSLAHEGMGLSYPCFRRYTHHCTASLYARILYRILPKSDNKCGKSRETHSRPQMKKPTCFTEPISMKPHSWSTFRFSVLYFMQVRQRRDRLCGLVVRVSGYRYRGPGFDPRRYQIFWVVVDLERDPLSLVSLVRSIEELLEWKK